MRREWQSTPVLLPGEFQDRGAQRSIALGSQRVGHTEQLSTYIANLKRAIRKLLELTKEFSKVAGHKINIQKSVAFLYTNKKYWKNKFRK